jgi:uncharacterized protein
VTVDYAKPLPRINSDNEAFWKGCREHELRFQKCAACGRVRWPASILCPGCHSRETEWINAGGHGTVYTYAVYHVAYHPGFAGDLPYVVAIVELDEGPHLLTNIVGCRPEEVQCGMEVVPFWEEVTPEVTLPKFRPVG